MLQLLCHVDVFRDGFPRKSTTCREFPLCIVFRDGKHAIPRWGLKKTRPRYIVGSVKKKTRCALCSMHYIEDYSVLYNNAVGQAIWEDWHFTHMWK